MKTLTLISILTSSNYLPFAKVTPNESDIVEHQSGR